MLTTAPPWPSRIISRTAACVATSVLRTLSSMIQSHASRGYSWASNRTLPAPPPTAFTMMSSRPKRSTVAATIRSHSDSWVTSAPRARMSAPSARSRSAAASARSSVTSTTVTLAPAAARAPAIADPMAPPPPGTRATFPSSPNLSR